MFYPTRYKDDHGTEETILFNDGFALKIKLRNVLFQGSDFDALEPVEYNSEEDLKSFTFQHNELCNCTIECQIPLIIIEEEADSIGILEIRLELGKPDHRNAIDREELFLKLYYENNLYEVEGKSDDFEGGLIALKKVLPNNTSFKCCFTCLYSDYSPYGQGLFGSLACFRGVKEDYLRLGNVYDIKHDLLDLWDKHTEYVQEIYLCPEYEKRKPNFGYRG